MNGDVRPRFCTFLPTATTSVMLLIATATLVGGQEAEEEEEEMTDWRSWPGGGALAARLAAEEGMDWRHLDGHLPFQWKYVHPTKRCAYQDSLGRPFRTMGVPLELGWETAWLAAGARPHDQCTASSGPASCYGGWVAELGKPIGPTRV
mmetsp:Transcript_71227/g.126885  ORF Transcript_71227/g.126885 Transcript_71227/m.126885 type:complete len:149 (-) Transcript_71227:28-474(-)